jgi:hypothetical protein
VDEPEDENYYYELLTMYRFGHSDGYVHYHTSALYTTFATAQAAGKLTHGNYAIDPRPFECIRLRDGRTFIVEGPVKTADEVELDKIVRDKILAKLTEEERRILGIEP